MDQDSNSDLDEADKVIASEFAPDSIIGQMRQDSKRGILPEPEIQIVPNVNRYKEQSMRLSEGSSSSSSSSRSSSDDDHSSLSKPQSIIKIG